LLEVRDLSTHFHTQDGVVKAVEHASYEVARGEVIALVGESGCGKTVSALSIVRLIQEPPGKIVSGQVNFNGTDLLKLSRQAIRKVRGSQIAMIFQEPMTSLNPVLTIRRQMTEALELHRGMKRQESSEEAIRLLERVGITEAERRIKDYPHKFSGGMRQRVMMAMAISCQPQLIIADEPTTAVDVTIQAQLLEMLHNITKDLDTAIILITHNLGIVARYAHRVYVMYAGRIVETGSAQDVYHDPRHPYTEGLIASVPRLDEPRTTRLVPIEGQPPDLIAPPLGCPFHPRCSRVQNQCREGTYELSEVTPGHYTSCRMAGKD
jgi:peptide/nickel transport system ATP-binding protein/oligopeptide transport system ATP-binding protein